VFFPDVVVLWRMLAACVSNEQALPDHAPVLLILPGLTGGSHDAYPLWAAVHGLRHGFRWEARRSHFGCPCCFRPHLAFNATENDVFGIRVQCSFGDAAVLILGYSRGAEQHICCVWHCRAVVFNARGTAGTPVATPRFYSASYTGKGLLGEMCPLCQTATHRRCSRPPSCTEALLN